jgi:hypothetical protein
MARVCDICMRCESTAPCAYYVLMMFTYYANLNVRIRSKPTLSSGLLTPQNSLHSIDSYLFCFRKSALPIVTHHQLLTGRNTYATQYKTFIHFFIGQRIIHFHRHRAFYNFAFTRTTNTSFAGIR